MIFTLLHILLSGVFLVLIPLCAGNALLSVTKLEKSLAFLYFSGLVLIWAVFQMITVPMVLIRLSFTETFTVLTIVMAMKKSWRKLRRVNRSISTKKQINHIITKNKNFSNSTWIESKILIVWNVDVILSTL